MNVFKRTCAGLWAIVKYEGINSLISRALTSINRRLFLVEKYYLECIDLTVFPGEEERDFLPRVNNYCVRIISTNKEADDVLAEGFTFGAYELTLRKTLDIGALSFCIFMGRELAHIHSLAYTQKSKDVIEPRPFHVDFNNGDIVGGRSITIPKYRRLRLRTYSGYLLRKYYKEKGYSRSMGTLGIKNYPALANSARNPYEKIVAVYRHIKILWFTYFKETKINPITVKELLEQRSDYIKRYQG